MREGEGIVGQPERVFFFFKFLRPPSPLSQPLFFHLSRAPPFFKPNSFAKSTFFFLSFSLP